MARALTILALALVFVACESTPPAPPSDAESNVNSTPLEPEAPAPAAEKIVHVLFQTTAGEFVVAVHPEWAPLGAQRFLHLVKTGYYDGAGFYRVMPGFIVQFGLAGDPAATRKWADARLRDDPVKQSNRRGRITFATSGPNTRTTDVFINYHNNGNLDRQGFAPFGEVVVGMDRVDRVSSAHGQQPSQREIRQRGNEYLKQFPKLDYIKAAKIVSKKAPK